jgi:transcriptional antiterminator NusG
VAKAVKSSRQKTPAKQAKQDARKAARAAKTPERARQQAKASAKAERRGMSKFFHDEGHLADAQGPYSVDGRRYRRGRHSGRLHRGPRRCLLEPHEAHHALERAGGNPVAVFQWYVVNTYSGHENKVKANLEHRIHSMSQEDAILKVVVPTEQVVETKEGQKVSTEKRVFPGYVLVQMELTDDSWSLVKNTPGVTGFVGAQNKPVALSRGEVDRILHTASVERPKQKAEFSVGEIVRVTSGPLSDFSGEVVEVNADQNRLKVMVSIFGRETPVELGFDQVKKTT